MTYNLLPVQIYQDKTGQPLVGGTLTAYNPGTTTPKTIYSMSSLGVVTPMSNPTAGFNNYGMIPGGIYGTGLYDLWIYDVNSNLVTTFYDCGNAADSTASSSSSTLPLSYATNRIINGNFRFSELSNPSNSSFTSNSGTQVAQGWYVLNQSGNLTFQLNPSSTNSVINTDFMVTNGVGSSTGLGLLQVISSQTTYALRNQMVQFSCDILSSTPGLTANIVLLYVTSTNDNPVINVVNNWTSTNYTAGNFFTSAATPCGTAVSTSISSAWTTLNCSGTVPSTATNLMAFVFFGGSGVSNTTALNFTRAAVYESASTLAVRPVTNAIETSSLIQYKESLLDNSDFKLAQRINPVAGTAIANNVYGFDQWKSLCSATASTVSTIRVNNPDSNCLGQGGYEGAQSSGSSTGFGIIQWLDQYRSICLRNQPVYVRARVNTSAATIVTVALLEWTGTADTITTNVVNNWASTNYTTGNFFNSTTLNVVGVTSITTTTTGFQDIIISGLKHGNAVNNVAVMVFAQSIASASNIQCSSVLYCVDDRPEIPKIYQPKVLPLELQNCGLFYEKTYDRDTIPGTLTNNGGFTFIQSTTSPYPTAASVFKTKKYTASGTFTGYSSSTGTTGKQYGFAGTVGDITLTTSVALGQHGGTLTASTNYSSSTSYISHWTYDCAL